MSPTSQMSRVLTIKADPARLADVRQFVREQAAELGADGEATDDMVTAVDELVTNSIIHGYRGGEGAVEVEIGASGTSMIVRLRDQAPPFDPTKLAAPDTTLPLEQRPKGGLGIYLSRAATDGLTYRRSEDGNETTLIRNLTSGEGG
jgi:serine/threonine-protein kinase RsbW